jgi:hypothetical protein
MLSVLGGWGEKKKGGKRETEENGKDKTIKTYRKKVKRKI